MMRKLLMLAVFGPLVGFGGCLSMGCTTFSGKGHWKVAQETSLTFGFEEDAVGADGKASHAEVNFVPLTEAIGTIAALWADPVDDEKEGGGDGS